jgi:hypothetical protein
VKRTFSLFLDLQNEGGKWLLKPVEYPLLKVLINKFEEKINKASETRNKGQKDKFN